MALATVADLVVIAGPQADAVRALRLLEMSSAVVERWCRRSFAFVADHPVTVHVTDGNLILPDGPVTAVGTVTGPGGTVYASTNYTWTPDGRVSHTWGTYEGYGHSLDTWVCGAYTVTYSHGYLAIPDDVILAVCQPVQRFLDNPSGFQSEAIGEAAFTYPTPGLGLTLSPVDKELLAPYRRQVTSMVVSR